MRLAQIYALRLTASIWLNLSSLVESLNFRSAALLITHMPHLKILNPLRRKILLRRYKFATKPRL
ncbi:MAG: hypothetical protein D8H92_10150 [Campylobacter sp.]|nr:hypothetical protein [uncultured Campylobacter sp.]RKV93881.1 MAG: hypothetical protein D8H92_10150 [Campylobacter sp.]